MKKNGLELVNDFLDFLGVRNDKNYIGTIFYGSYSNNLQHENSDIDLIIVFKNLDKQYKSYKRYKDISFEYYERSLDSLYKRIDKDIENGNDSSLSIIGYGTLIDNNKELYDLQKFTRHVYLNRWPPKTNNIDIKYKLIGINKSIDYLKCLLKHNDPYFNIYYALSLEKIRNFYHMTHGLSKIGTSKVYKIYNNKEIAKKEHRILPDDEFISLFNNCVLNNNNNDKLSAITILYKYVVKDYDIDFDNIRIELNGREY